MTRRRALLAVALVLPLVTSACSAITTEKAAPVADSPAASPSKTSASPSPARPTPAAAPALTPAQAQAALVTDVDLGEPWAPTQGAATWRDGVLKGTADSSECQKLLDALYSERLFGGSAHVRAAIGLDDTWNDAQLHHQVVAVRPADVDRAMAWLKTLPKKCGTFTAVTGTGAVQNAAVTDGRLPKIGDARQALRVTLTGESADGEETTLTVDLAAVRVGDDALLLTNGGLGDVYAEVTQAVAELAAKRLTDVRKQARVEV